MAVRSKPIYEPPFSRPLSSMGVTGQGPEGSCESGDYPYYNCVNGSYFVGSCSPTGVTVDTSSCLTGSIHTRPACSTGSKANTNCWSGMAQQPV